jgi:hypothetical protein
MINTKTISVLLLLMLSSTFAFAQHEELMERAHGIPQDQMLQRLLQNNGVNENTTPERLQELIAYYYEHEADLLYEYDVERHKVIVEGVSQARAARQAQWGQAMAGVLSGVAQGVEASQQQARAEKEAKEQARAQRVASQQAQAAADRQQMLQSQSNTNSAYVDPSAISTGSTGSKRDLYTSDPAWNKTVDLLVQQHGLEKARQMVQQMRANNTQAPQPAQSSYQTTSGTGNPVGTIVTAVTANRTMIYININGSSITHYATGKDSLGKYNWQYVGAVSTTSINMTPYEAQFGKEYSRAANINGVGYVFFN